MKEAIDGDVKRLKEEARGRRGGEVLSNRVGRRLRDLQEEHSQVPSAPQSAVCITQDILTWSKAPLLIVEQFIPQFSFSV